MSIMNEEKIIYYILKMDSKPYIEAIDRLIYSLKRLGFEENINQPHTKYLKRMD